MGIMLGVGNNLTCKQSGSSSPAWWELLFPGATMVLDFENSRAMLNGLATTLNSLITGHAGLIDTSGLHVDSEDVHFIDQTWHSSSAGTFLISAEHTHDTNIVLLGLQGIHGIETHPDDDIIEHYNGTLIAASAGSGNWSTGAKAALSWDSGNRRMCMGGGAVVEEASTAGAVSTIYLGSRSGTSKFWNGHIHFIAYYPDYKSAVELQSLTT